MGLRSRRGWGQWSWAGGAPTPAHSITRSPPPGPKGGGLMLGTVLGGVSACVTMPHSLPGKWSQTNEDLNPKRLLNKFGSTRAPPPGTQGAPCPVCLRCTSGSPQSRAQGDWSPSSRPLGLSSRCRSCPVHGPRAELRSHTGLMDVPALVSLVQVAGAVVPSGRALGPLQPSLWLLPHSLPASHQGPGPGGCVSTAPPPHRGGS